MSELFRIRSEQKKEPSLSFSLMRKKKGKNKMKDRWIFHLDSDKHYCCVDCGKILHGLERIQWFSSLRKVCLRFLLIIFLFLKSDWALEDLRSGPFASEENNLGCHCSPEIILHFNRCVEIKVFIYLKRFYSDCPI